MKLTFKQYLVERDQAEFTVDGYGLYHTEDVEEDNRKLWHHAITPDGKEETLHHTPYEYLDREGFAKYVEYHKKHGKWPGRAGGGNWSNDTLDKLDEANVKELTKVKEKNGKWYVMVLSAATGKWIPQGEWNTEREAEQDRKNWL